ncbi:MAG: hypothetical protein WD851_05230 [Pirellulales bacterium]
MTCDIAKRSALLAALLVSCSIAHIAGADSRFTASWTLPTLHEAEQRFREWLVSQPLDDNARQAAIREFGDHLAQGTDSLTALVRTLATFDERTRTLIAPLEPSPPQFSAGDIAWLDSAESKRFDVMHLRLFYARALNEARQHDEALRWMQDIEPREVICPEVLLFQRAIAHQQLVQADEALAAIDELLRCESALPARYSRLAAMMSADLEPLKADTLDHIGRRMSDVERRLQVGQANSRTTEVEEAIIASLDKLIKEAEDQQQQKQNQQTAQSQPTPSGTPLEDSRIAELKAPGKVDPRKLGDDTQWGSLPPHERERIMQQLGRDFPSHYREVVEEYFRNLARDEEQPSQRP